MVGCLDVFVHVFVFANLRACAWRSSSVTNICTIPTCNFFCGFPSSFYIFFRRWSYTTSHGRETRRAASNSRILSRAKKATLENWKRSSRLRWRTSQAPEPTFNVRNSIPLVFFGVKFDVTSLGVWMPRPSRNGFKVPPPGVPATVR